MNKEDLKILYSEICNILNNLEDDLQLDFKEGEHGYKNYEDSYNAVKKNTLKLLKKREKSIKKKLVGDKENGNI